MADIKQIVVKVKISSLKGMNLSSASTIGERIKAVRQRAGLGQQAFGDALGYSKRSVIAWETGAAEPPVVILPILRYRFDADPEWVIMGEDTEPQSYYGPEDWDRYDRILSDVKAVAKEVGLRFAPEDQDRRQQALARVLYDDGEQGGKDARKRLRNMLLALSLGD